METVRDLRKEDIGSKGLAEMAPNLTGQWFEKPMVVIHIECWDFTGTMLGQCADFECSDSVQAAKGH